MDDSLTGVTGTMVNPLSAAIPAPTAHPATSRFSCTNCHATFKRDGDRRRHIASKHLAIQGVHLCPIAGCPQSQGTGYSRADKLTEHLWKKHADRGYTKAGM